MGHAANCGRKKTGKKRGKSKKKLKCNLCDQTASTVKKLSEHRRKMHADLPNRALLKCTVCQKSFAYIRNFKSHMMSHRRGKKQFRCNHCSCSFNFLRNLDRHKLSHLELRSFPCKVCGKVFSRGCNLTRHMQCHSGPETRYKCSQCALDFSRLDNLNRHMLRQHLETPSSQVESGDGGIDVSQDQEGTQPEVEDLSQYDHIRNSTICSITDRMVEHLRSTGSTERQISFFIEAQKKKIIGSMPISTEETDVHCSSSPAGQSVANNSQELHSSNFTPSTTTVSSSVASLTTSTSLETVSLHTPLAETSQNSGHSFSSAEHSRWEKFLTSTPTEPSSSLKSGFPCTICVGRKPFRDSYALERHMKSIHGHWVSLISKNLLQNF